MKIRHQSEEVFGEGCVQAFPSRILRRDKSPQTTACRNALSDQRERKIVFAQQRASFFEVG